MPDVIGASRTSDVPRLAEMDRTAAIAFTDGGGVSVTRIATTSTAVPTVGSGGSGTSALSIVAGSSNTAGMFQVTLTGVAPGVVCGVVSFGGAPLASAPLVVVCSLSAPTAGVAAPPVVGADTYTASGFTVRNYGPTTVTTGTYVINWIALF